MENKMYNQPAYNTEYNVVPGGAQGQPGAYPTAYPAAGYPSAPPPYSPDDYPGNRMGYPQGYPVQGYPVPCPVPMDGYNTNYSGGYGAPAPATGYYVQPQGMPPVAAPPPVHFVAPVDNESHTPMDVNQAEGATNFGASFSDKNIRRVFVRKGGMLTLPYFKILASTKIGANRVRRILRKTILRKVYSILLLQLLFTFGIVAIFIFVDKVKFYVQHNLGIYWASYAVFLVTYITLACCPSVRRRYPANIICLAVFTLALSYMTGTISSFYDTKVVFIAAGICAGVCLGITLLSMWSKFDVTGCGFFLVMISLVLFWFGIMCCWTYNDVLDTVYCALAAALMMLFDITGCGIYLAVASLVLFFFGLFAIFTYNSILYTVYSSLFALLMMFFLAYDTQMIMGGRRHELSPEEHIIAALNLYLDIVYIFLILLTLLGRGK